MANTYSLDFNGSTQYGKKDNPTALDALTAICLEAWFKVDTLHATLNDMDFVATYGTRAGLAEQVVQLFLNGDGTNVKLKGLIGDTSGGGRQTTITGSTNIAINTWYHAVITYDGSNVRLWLGTQSVNDTEDATAVALSGATLNTPAITHDSIFVACIGITAETDIGDFFDGKIDEVRFWNTNRTGAQLNANKNIQLVGNESGLVTYYKNNEGTGTSVNDETTSNNDLTLTGTPAWLTDVPFTEEVAAISSNRAYFM